MSRTVTCTHCGGSGHKSEHYIEYDERGKRKQVRSIRACSHCKGRGYRVVKN